MYWNHFTESEMLEIQPDERKRGGHRISSTLEGGIALPSLWLGDATV